MLKRMKELLREKEMCVLATSLDNRPHCSLMAYIADDESQVVYMVTRKDTRKYKTLTENPHVCLFLDTRGEAPSRDKIQALTVSGTYHPVDEGTERERILKDIITRYPHLSDLALHPDAEPISIRVETFLLLAGPLDAYFEKVG